MKRYNQLNNVIGWATFVVAAVTYLLTIEPTASFWDCGEFIAQGDKLEVGHPPGNPIFMLVARFFINFAGGDVSKVAMCVNAMSALLSAATILLLFWSITHLVRRLLTKGFDDAPTPLQMLVIFGSGVCGALAYTWSDTFWFSAVEGEVYAFSSFCTALVFWLILKWENRADDPSSDRYLILIAYVIGVSVAVHLLNLLCIPAIVLVFYYRKWQNTTAKGSLIALLVSFAIIVAILYGLVPGFVETAQYFELFFVNTLGMGFNTGVIIYALLNLAIFCWCIYELYAQRSPARIKCSFFLSIFLSGMLFIGDGWLLPIVLTIALGTYLYGFCKRIPVRIFNIIIISVLVIFIGYSSYAVILIRSNARTPMDQNSPDNVFALASYLNREQYGERPLLWGRTVFSQTVYKIDGTGYSAVKKVGKPLYAKEVKTDPSQPDRYVLTGNDFDYMETPELNMLFPRVYSSEHLSQYASWLDMSESNMTIVPNATVLVDADGNKVEDYSQPMYRPTFAQNMTFFLNYQVNYMYWRYFMWNFAGRQNDLQGNGEITHGNWISGIPLFDNPRLGDQSLLPDDLGRGNKGHNVFYLLPLLLGIIGLLWQAFKDKRGIEQFWVVFFLFFMTGLAIVVYLNQTPGQPRERDYAFAGSFYAYAIWIGMGVAGIWQLVMKMIAKRRKNLAADGEAATEALDSDSSTASRIVAYAAVAIGLFVPLQMLSQTWDDHDRSGRYACRDFGMNYLSSVEPNGIIFTNGDNDTFPLWYAQEVEGYRTDVRVVNLSYLATDWYIAQMRRQAYESAPLPMLANDLTFAYGSHQANRMDTIANAPMPVLESLADLYSPSSLEDPSSKVSRMRYPVMYMPVDKAAVEREHRVNNSGSEVLDSIDVDLLHNRSFRAAGGIYSNKLAALDIIASSVAQGWKRPIYWASTVPDDYYMGFEPYMACTGLAYELTPQISVSLSGSLGVDTDRMYDIVTKKFRWGGLDAGRDLYIDETVGRMVTTHRNNMLDLAESLIEESQFAKIHPEAAKGENYTTDRLNRARAILNLMDEKLPPKVQPYSVSIGAAIAQTWLTLGKETGVAADTERGLAILEQQILRLAQYVRFYQSLSLRNHTMLSREDEYIEQTLFPNAVVIYNHAAGDAKSEALLKKIADMGVNMNSIFADYGEQ